MPPGRCSFILVSYNTARLTAAALSSIRRFGGVPTCEVILVDNGSTDGTPSLVRTQFPDVRVVCLEENRGFAAANNAGARLATGEWLVLMNSDAEILPDTMAQLEALLREHPTVGVLGGQLLNSDGSLQTSLLLAKPVSQFEAAHQNEEILDVAGIVGAFMVVRNDLWRALGGMDEGFFFYFEETDLCQRASRAGARVCWSPRVRILHHGGGSSGKFNPRTRVEFHASLYHSWRKEMSPAAFRRCQRRMALRFLFNATGNLMICLLTLGLLRGARRRLAVYTRLLCWHFLGCPDGWGLRPAGPAQSVTTPMP